MIIDSHVHADIVWSEPVEALMWQMERNGVSHAILTQLNGHFDNSYLVECLKRFPGKFKAAGIFDAQDFNRVKKLEQFRKDGGSGMRMNIRNPRDWGIDNSLLEAAGEMGMIVGVIGQAADFASPRFKKLLDACPKTHFCLEHLARSPTRPPAILDELKPPYDVYRQALECAKWPNTSVKVPGLGEIILRNTEVMPERIPWEIPPHYEMAKAAFGVQRMMWGSNFPPCGAVEGYRNALEWVRTIPAFQGEGDLDWILGKSAAKIWGFA